MFLPIGNLDNCGRWLLLKRGDGKQLALTHRATAAPQIVTLLQIVATNYTLPRYSDGGVDCQFFSSATQKGKSKMCYNLHVQLMFMYGNPRLLRFVCACLFACTNIKVLWLNCYILVFLSPLNLASHPKKDNKFTSLLFCMVLSLRIFHDQNTCKLHELHLKALQQQVWPWSNFLSDGI